MLNVSLKNAINSNSLEVVKWLLKKTSILSQSVIKNAIKNANHPKVLKYLLKHHMSTRDKKNALYFASSAEIINILVKGGIDINECNKLNKNSLTPLQYAFRRKWRYEQIWRRPKVVEALLKNGVDPRIKNKYVNVLFLAFRVRYNGPDILSIKTLLKYGADVNITNSKGDTLLSLAVKKKNCYVTDILLDAGADISLLKKEDIKKSKPYIQWRIKQALLKQKEKNIISKQKAMSSTRKI